MEQITSQSRKFMKRRTALLLVIFIIVALFSVKTIVALGHPNNNQKINAIEKKIDVVATPPAPSTPTSVVAKPTPPAPSTPTSVVAKPTPPAPSPPTSVAPPPAVKAYVAPVCTQTPIPYETIYIDDENLEKGKTKVYDGIEGTIYTCTADSYGNGAYSSTVEPYNKKIYVGTLVKPSVQVMSRSQCVAGYSATYGAPHNQGDILRAHQWCSANGY